MGNQFRHFHECGSCHFEYECGIDSWIADTCIWNDLVPQDQRCMDCIEGE